MMVQLRARHVSSFGFVPQVRRPRDVMESNGPNKWLHPLSSLNKAKETSGFITRLDLDNSSLEKAINEVTHGSLFLNPQKVYLGTKFGSEMGMLEGYECGRENY